MNTTLQSLYNQLMFMLSTLTWFGLIDLLLVTLTFYLLLSLIRRSSAAYLLREVMVLGLVLFVLTTLLPLPVFDWLVRGFLVAVLVAIPIIFQVQLRHFIERTARAVGITRVARQSAAEQVIPEIVHAVDNMAATQTGALIVLENNDSLEETIKGGVRLDSQVTSDLLQSIFYSGTPLHDGAVIIRTDRIVAAGCVLPLTQQPLESEKRLGTRHRATVGVTEVSDALAIVVSEETGYIGTAQYGQLERPLTNADLRDKLLDFYEPTTDAPPKISLLNLVKQALLQLWHAISLSNPRQLLANIGLFIISLMLAFTVWSFVIEQTNPIKPARVENIALRVENVPANTRLIPTPPASVSAIIQTTEDVLSTLSPKSFQAIATLADPKPGLQRLPIRINSGPAQVLVMQVDPPALDLELARVISRTLPVAIEIPPQQGLAAAYEMIGSPTTTPPEVQLIGPAPLIEQVSKLQATISLANASGPVKETRPVKVLDEQGHEITDITPQPAQVQVSVNIRRRINARNVSIRAVTSGTPPAGYWLSSLSVTPDNVTLQGRPDQLANIDSFVDTLPVDIGQAVGNLSQQIPLDIPSEIQVLDSAGNPIETVTVVAQISARQGDLAVTRPIELVQKSAEFTITLKPSSVDLLLSGPLPTLDQIRINPELVQVLIDTTTMRRGQNINLTPTVIAPPEIQTQLVPATVLVTLE